VIHLTGAEDVTRALDGHVYGRFSTGMAANVGGLATHDAVLWWGDTHFGRLAHAFGPGESIKALMAAGRDRMGAAKRTNVRRTPGQHSEHAWDFRWTTSVPPHHPGQEAVVEVHDMEAVNGLLDVGFPDTSVRPGDPIVLSWYGIWSGDRLVACGADRSTRPPGSGAEPTTGMIGGVAVHPGCRGRGLAAAISAALTTRLVTSYGLSCLGVMAGNDAATRIYLRLGYHDVLPLIGLVAPT
jgi:ribosomal protein S18 acetylase RimI-like enzyme